MRSRPITARSTSRRRSAASRVRSSLALVGHEPDLGELAAWLIGAKEPLPFRKGGICLIEAPVLPPGRNCALVWFATPKMLRAMKGR